MKKRKKSNGLVSAEHLEQWSAEIDELSRGIPEEDFERLEAALAEADREDKLYERRRMDLS